MAGLSTYGGNLLLNFLLKGAAASAPAGLYLSLHTADPGLTGASEVSTSNTGYSRQALAFNAAAGKSATNSGTASQTLTGSALPVTVTFLGLWDAASGGDFLWGWAVTTSKTYNSGDTWSVAAGAETLSLT